MPDHLILGKSLVKIQSVDADVWDGVESKPIAFVPPPGYRRDVQPEVSLELGGPWAFYKQFQAAHGIATALSFVKPQTAFSAYSQLWIPLLIHNDTDQPRDLLLQSLLPEGWTTVKDTRYHVEAHSTYPAQLFLTRETPLPKSATIVLTPSSTMPVTPTQNLAWKLSDAGKPAGEASITVYLEYNGVPQ